MTPGRSNLAQEAEWLVDSLHQYGRSIAEQNQQNRTDEANRAEYFYQGLLNLLFDWSLININRPFGLTHQEFGGASGDVPDDALAAGIDLCHASAGIAVQVTSRTRNRIDKVRDALKKTADRKEDKLPPYTNVTDLYVLFISEGERMERVRQNAEQIVSQVGITVHAIGLDDLADWCLSLVAAQPNESAKLRNAVQYAREYFAPSHWEGGVLTPQEHDELDYAWKVLEKLKPLRKCHCFRTRSCQHFERRYAPFARPQQILPDTGFKSPSAHVTAEALREEGRLIWLWGVDQDYIQSIHSLIDWFERGGEERRVGIRFSSLSTLGKQQQDILTLSREVRDTFLRLNSPLHWEMGMIPFLSCEPAPLGPDTHLVRYYWININPSYLGHSWPPEFDADVRRLGESVGRPGDYDLMVGLARSFDALVETLDARIEDHDRQVLNLRMRGREKATPWDRPDESLGW